MFILLQKDDSQSDETGVLKILEIKFLSLPNHDGSTFTIFFHGFTIHLLVFGISLILLNIKRLKNL